jgi:outer membrane protein assembly factor BamB
MALVLGLTGLVGACAEKELILTGERFDPRAPLEASIPVEGQPAPVDTTNVVENQSVPIGLPPVVANAEWTHRSGNVRHLPPHAALSSAPVRVWSVGLGSGSDRRNRISAAPVVGGGRVFAMDAIARVSGISTQGGLIWATDLRPEGDSSDLSGGGLAYGDGQLFATTGYGELIALDPATGAVRWRQRLGAPAGGAPAVDGGIVYAVARDSSAWAVSADNGRVLWQLPGTPSPSGMIASAGPSVTDTAVFFPFASGEVVAALKAGGVPLWSATVAGERRGRAYAGVGDITGDAVVDGRVTYIGNQGGRTVALETETGQRLWTAKDASYGPVLPVGGAIFLVNDEARLVRLDASTGETVWEAEMPYYEKARKENKRVAITAHYGPVLAGGRLVVASGDGALRFFNPADGSLVGTADIPGGAASLPALAGGTLFVAGQNGQLHAFR